MAKSDCELLKLIMKFHRPVKRRVIKKTSHVPAPLTMDTMPETTGIEEMEDIEKREYGFDWEKSKGLNTDE